MSFNIRAIWNPWAKFSHVHIAGSPSVCSSLFLYRQLNNSSNSFFDNILQWPIICSHISLSSILTSPSPLTCPTAWMIFLGSPSTSRNQLKSFMNSLHKIFQQTLTVCGFNSSTSYLINVITSAIVRDFQQHILSRLGSTPIADQMRSNIRWVYVTNQVPWSKDWSHKAIFGGKKYNFNIFNFITNPFRFASRVSCTLITR
jgi:hypothetical protein